MQGSGNQDDRECRSWGTRGPDPAQVCLRRWCWSRKCKAGNVQEAGCILTRMGSFEWNHCLGYSRWSEEGLLSSKQGEVRSQKAQSGR